MKILFTRYSRSTRYNVLQRDHLLFLFYFIFFVLIWFEPHTTVVLFIEINTIKLEGKRAILSQQSWCVCQKWRKWKRMRRRRVKKKQRTLIYYIHTRRHHSILAGFSSPFSFLHVASRCANFSIKRFTFGFTHHEDSNYTIFFFFSHQTFKGFATFAINWKMSIKSISIRIERKFRTWWRQKSRQIKQ